MRHFLTFILMIHVNVLNAQNETFTYDTSVGNNIV